MEVHKKRTRVLLKEHGIENTVTDDFPGNYPQYDDRWNLKKFEKNFKINIVRHDNMEMEFDMIGINASVANAFRRILLAEVPTMAVDRVFIYNNTSLIQDEILAHRIGLIPFKADPRLFEYRQEGDENGTSEDTLEFHLKIKCTKNRNAPKESAVPEELLKDHIVTSAHIKWNPIGNQAELEIDCKLHVVKGIGKDHAKFSPVATATYRLLPEIKLLREIEGKDAWQLAECFADGVIDIVKLPDGREVAKVANARKDTCTRNVFRYKNLKNSVELTKVKDHFIFLIESTGALPPDVLMCEAIKILMGKCKKYIDELDRAEIKL